MKTDARRQDFNTKYKPRFDAGWRGYYWVVHDPRWDQLRADPRFQALMAAVKKHVEAQRAAMELIDAEENFGVRVDL